MRQQTQITFSTILYPYPCKVGKRGGSVVCERPICKKGYSVLSGCTLPRYVRLCAADYNKHDTYFKTVSVYCCQFRFGYVPLICPSNYSSGYKTSCDAKNLHVNTPCSQHHLVVFSVRSRLANNRKRNPMIYGSIKVLDKCS